MTLPFAIVPLEATIVMVAVGREVLGNTEIVGVDFSARVAAETHAAMVANRPASCRELEAAIFGEGGLMAAAAEIFPLMHLNCGVEQRLGAHCYICAAKRALARVLKLMEK